MIGLEPLAEVLCLGYLGQGRDHVILEYLSEASNMSILMGLFGIEGRDAAKEEAKLLRLVNEEREHAYMRHGEGLTG